ncbi:hypothetical protein HOLleu_42690 [Holothuria leucospilota]|uniref:Uncharacterized protein n=1 Tax=Holothuria leucospilota TaxID=206669 RepID=A0A9Q0YAD0_HOLLE|nr:hypothetical protein HOLleu_42690 [Holothuria leucospilota]
MISCFHSHMKNKIEDENVEKYDLFETEHTELDKLAFEGLSRKDQQIVWSKHYMCERLGQDFYNQYVRTGILVEEEVLDISDDPNLIICEHIKYKTEVKFYHKLFCEWYAANHLSEYASRNDITFDHHYLKYLDPFDLQYVYRFSCGLNRKAADKIIGYLKTREDATKFAILCILEKSGKVEDVLEDVEDLCSKTVKINNDDTLLLQRSTIQLLEIATTNKVSKRVLLAALIHIGYSRVLDEQHPQLMSRSNNGLHYEVVKLTLTF